MKYIKFWKVFGENGMFSPMYDEKFKDDTGRNYRTVEQYIAVQKAFYFGRSDIAEQLMNETTTFSINKLLSEVDTTKKAGWENIQKEIATKGYIFRLKHSLALNDEIQKLKDQNVIEKDSVFVYAHPYDAYWGIKLEGRSYACEDPETWQGKNMMGYALTDAFHINEERLRNII